MASTASFRFTWKITTAVALILISTGLTGCRFGAVETLPSSGGVPASIEIDNQAPMPTYINSGSGFTVSWQASGDEDVVSVQESSDGITWNEIATVSTLAGSAAVDPNDVSLPDGDVKFRLQVGETLIDLGSVTVDRTPPVVSATLGGGGPNGLYFGCPAAMSLFGSATDNLTLSSDIIYTTSDDLTPYGLSGCLNGTNSRQCTKAPATPYPASITYKAVDEAGNEATGTLITALCN